MNWYRLAQVTAPVQRPIEYTDIGHMRSDDFDNLDQSEFLWIWLDGRVKYEEHPVSSQIVHGQIWPAETLARTWSGCLF